MKTLEQTIRSQKTAQTFWTWFLIVSFVMITIPFLPLPLEAEIGFAAAFIGIVFFITAVVVLVMYVKRKKAAENLGQPENRIAEWLVPDRYQENGGQPVTALFSKAGIFYGGQIYPVASYSCRIEKAQLTADEGGGILEIEYSAAARYGRRKHYLNIPIPSWRGSRSPRVGGVLYALIFIRVIWDERLHRPKKRIRQRTQKAPRSGALMFQNQPIFTNLRRT